MINKISFYSNILNKEQRVNVIIPDINRIRSARVLVLLHGLGGNENSYIEKSDIEKIASDLNLIIIMPNGDRSFYCNLINGENYFDYFKEEVIDMVIELFHLEENDKYILGISMGGYGAFKLGLIGDRYKGIGSISGSLDIITRDKEKRMIDNDVKIEWESMFGQKVDDCNDLFLYLDKCYNKNVYITVGRQDYLFGANEKMHNSLNDLDIKHEYIVKDGEHNAMFFYPNLLDTILYIIGEK